MVCLIFVLAVILHNMPKFLTSILTFLILTTASGQVTVNLTLKFTGESPIVYKAITRTENPDSVKMGFSFFGEDSTLMEKLKANDFFSQNLRRQFTTNNYFVIKKINDNKFLVAYTDSGTINDILSFNKKYNAYIDNKGRNLSFYLSNNVSIMTKLFFELPDKNVKIGDTWQLGIDMTEFGGFVKCDSSYKKDTVRVTDIAFTNEDTLVTIQYDFQEYFKGVFYTATTSNMKYYGNATFSVKRGLWIKYDCIKEVEMTGFANLKSKEIYKLELTTDYPKVILAQLDE